MEIADADSEGVGRVVVTDLGNYLMPLIRYDHGDLARLSNGSCRCGRSFRGLDALHGRRDDALIAADGRYVPTASVMAACDALLTDERSGMNEYRLIQCSANQIELHYVRSPGSGTDSALRLRLSKTGCLISLVIVLSFRLSATTHYRHSRAINAGYCSGRGMDADEHVFMHGICAATRTDGNGCVFARSGTQVDRRKVRRRHRGRIASRSGRHLLARGQCYRLRSRWTGVHRCWLPRPHACASSHCIAWNWHPFLHRRSCNQKAEYRSLQYSARQCRQCCGVRTRHHHRQCCGCRRQCGRRADRELLAADAVESCKTGESASSSRAHRTGTDWPSSCIGAREIVYASRTRKPALEREYGVRSISVRAMVAECDVVSIHVGYSQETHHMFDATMFAACRPDLRLHCFSNPRTIDPKAARCALEKGHVGHIYMDGYYREWTYNVGKEQDSEGLLTLPYSKFTATSHLAAQSIDAINRQLTMALRQLIGDLQNE